MKRNLSIVFIAVIAIFSNHIKAQSIYVNGGIGYGFPLAPMSFSVNYSSASVQGVSGSCGKGFLPNLGVGYSFNEHVSAEININYLAGNKIEFSDTYSLGTPKELETLKAKMLRIIPAIKITTGNSIKPYARFGLVMGVFNRLYDDHTYYNPLWTGGYDTYHTFDVFKGNVAFGFSAAVGADFTFSDKVSIYGELGTISQGWAPKKSVRTTYEINGEDRFATLDQKDKEVDFVDSYNPNIAPVPTESTKSLKVHLPFSSWGINIGVHINIGSKKA